MSVQESLIQLLDYIKEAERALKRPQFSLPSENFLCKWEHEIRGLEGVTFDVPVEGEQIWLRINRLIEEQPPSPPNHIAEWVKLSKSPSKEPSLRNIKEVIADREPDQKDIEKYSRIKPAFKAYLETSWRQWAAREALRRRTIALYNELFTLQQVMESETTEKPLELVWGIGIAIWDVERGHAIRYPIIGQLCEITINRKDYSIEIRPREMEPTLQVEPFIGNDVHGVVVVEDAWKKFIARQDLTISPFDYSSYDAILKTAVAHLDPGGVYLPDKRQNRDDKILPKAEEHLVITDSWVLFARRRTGGLIIQDIERLKDKIGQKDNIPGGISALVTPPSDEVSSYSRIFYRGVSYSGNVPAGAEVRELYFAKAFNDEQVSIIEKLENSDGVVVQGPPGTGKTHTIANIICHYLAQGKKVLVTSYGETALAVLQNQIPNEIRDLTVSLLTNEREGMKQFEHSIKTIAGQVSRINEREYEPAISGLKQRIDKLHEEMSFLDRSITEWANMHLSPISIGGREVMPDQLAHYVLDHEEEHSWLQDELMLHGDHEPRFSVKDIDSLREARLALGQDLSYLNCIVPAANDFPDSAEVLKAHQDLVRAVQIDEELQNCGAPHLADSSSRTLECAHELLEKVEKAIGIIDRISSRGHDWTDKLRNAYKDDNQQVINILQEVVDEIDRIEVTRKQFLATPVSIPDQAVFHVEFQEIVVKLADGKSPFGLFSFGKGELKAMASQVTVSKTPLALDGKNQSEWSIVQKYLHFIKRANKAMARWNAVAEECGLPSVKEKLPDCVKTLASLGEHISDIKCLVCDYDKVLPKMVTDTFATSFKVMHLLNDRDSLAHLRDLLSRYLTKSRLACANSFRDGILQKLAGKTGAIVERIKRFAEIQLGNPEQQDPSIQSAWSELMAELRRVNSLKGHLMEVIRVTDLVSTSGGIKWAKALSSEPATDSDALIPSNWLEAWHWRQAHTYLESINGREELSRLRNRRNECELDLASSYKRLVAKMTWLGVYKKSTNVVKSALQGYLNAISKIGKGTGIRAVRYRRDARIAMLDAYPAVPCWIMPHWRVSETLPPEIGFFDLVIVDEASQSDLWAIPSLLRGKKLLIVGDDKQVSPEGIGMEEAKIKELYGRFLKDQPFGPEMTPEKSLYDLARRVFAGNFVMLCEHFRCVKPIISFSNREFYSNDIQPLRIPKASERIDPPLVDVFVMGGYREERSKINKPEARAIVNEIKTIIKDPSMKGRSIGVVSLLGNEQAQYIFQLLEQEVGLETILSLQIACGDARTFQGKERDIMFLSLVHDKRTTQTSGRIYEQRYNVAASRARDRMYLFRSVQIEELKPSDLKAKLINHFSQPFGNDPEEVADLRKRCESPFEREVFDSLTSLGYMVTPQVPLGAYRIDLVVEGENDRRLAVECDGDKYHGPGQWIHDMRRQRVLERAGWSFWRCFASSFTMDKKSCMNDLLLTLERIGIQPGVGSGMKLGQYTEHRVVKPDPTDFQQPLDETNSSNIPKTADTQGSHIFGNKPNRNESPSVAQTRQREEAPSSQFTNTQQEDLFNLTDKKNLPRDWQSWEKIALWAKKSTSINTFWGDFAAKIALALRQKKSISAKDDHSMKKLWDMYRRKAKG